MSFLERYDPALFERYLRCRQFDRRITDAFGDLEAVIRLDGTSTGAVDELTSSIVAELIEELRQRIAACEKRRSD